MLDSTFEVEFLFIQDFSPEHRPRRGKDPYSDRTCRNYGRNNPKKGGNNPVFNHPPTDFLARDFNRSSSGMVWRGCRHLWGNYQVVPQIL